MATVPSPIVWCVYCHHAMDNYKCPQCGGMAGYFNAVTTSYRISSAVMPDNDGDDFDPLEIPPTKPKQTIKLQPVKACDAETKRLRYMLYRMTSLTDWMREGFDESEYNAICKEFEETADYGVILESPDTPPD